MLIKNKVKLASKGCRKERKILLDIIEDTLIKMNYYAILKKIVKLSDNTLKIRNLEFNLNNFQNIYVIGGGKNSSFMVQALEDILKDKIKDGVVVEKKGCKLRTKRILMLEGNHPTPNLDSVKAAKKILEILKKGRKDDLLIVCVSGGWTALTSLPPRKIPLDDYITVHDMLLKSGMTVEEMNIVRNHLSCLGRGKIPILANRATVVGLIAIDEVDGKPWGPTTPDPSTFSDAIESLKHFDMFDKIPTSVKTYIESAPSAEETPKKTDYNKKKLKVHNIILANNIDLCEAAQKSASDFNIDSFILSTGIRGEAKYAGTVIAAIANEIAKFGRPFNHPCILILGGETTVTITSEPGQGGRNQELALSSAQDILGVYKVVIASIATDGTDGPTDIAGAIVDGTTIQSAKKLGIDVTKELKNHNSSFVLTKTEDAIYTHDTGTNLMDLIMVYIA